MNTYIGKFNFYLNSFLNELIVIFPENKSCFEKNYQEIIDNKESVNETYIKDYMDKISEYHSDIAKKNDKLFKSDKEIYLLKDIDFRDLWSKDLSDTTRENLWKYLQTLYVLGKKIVTSDDEVSNMLDELNSENIPEPEFDEMKQMMENMSKITQNVKKDENINDLFNNGIISDIAKELTNEIDISKMDVGEPKNMNEAFNNIMGGSGGNNFFDLINKVGQKIQNKVEKGEINQGDLINEAQKMMGGLKNPEQLARNMKQQNNSNPTRNRLRKKLEKRNKESNT
tara:strand:+ start:405 stop:1256 length:852 start_codon:yes stop_codon:yes gene_type:complete